MQRTMKGLRNDLGYTQEQMAKAIKVPVATYVRYENLQTKIPFQVAIKICDMCKIADPREVKFY